MSFPRSQVLPEDPEPPRTTRKRRIRRGLDSLKPVERVSIIEDIFQETSLPFSFYILSLLSGITLSFGLAFDLPVLIVLGAALAPSMIPIIGLALGMLNGSLNNLFRSVSGMIFASGLVTTCGYLFGFLNQSFLHIDYTSILIYSDVRWIDYVVMGIAVSLMTYAFINGSSKPFVISAALAYVLYKPLVTAGLALRYQAIDLWSESLMTWLVYITGATSISILYLISFGFRPYKFTGYLLGITFLMIAGIISVWNLVPIQKPVNPPPLTNTVQPAKPSNLSTPTEAQTKTFPTSNPTATQTHTAPPPTGTKSPTFTQTPVALSPTSTIQPSPTPILALVDAGEEGGANLRDEPKGKIIAILSNGTLLKVLPESVEKGGLIWIHVITNDGIEGWIVQNLLVTATPAPNWGG